MTQAHIHAIASEVSRALEEDIRGGDVTAVLIPETRTAHASLVTRDPMVVAGIPYVNETFAQLSPDIEITWQVSEGDDILAESVLATFQGPARAVLTGERTALNFLQLLSAVATKTRRLAKQLQGTGAALFDTRKTLPGLRLAQKYAVVIGGGQNHRIGLFDQVLIKENHIAAAGSLSQAVQSAQTHHPDLRVQVEVETFAEYDEALSVRPDIIMLDNFDIDDLKHAVTIRNKQCPSIELEASGGITENNLRAIGETGVDRISLGTLTKDIDAIDLSLRVELS